MKSSYIDFQLFASSGHDSGDIQCQGSGKKGILVLHSAPELIEEDREFLTNILKAVQLTPIEENIFLLACPSANNLSLVKLCRAQNIHTVFLFGVPLQQVGIRAQLPDYFFTRLGELYLLKAHEIGVIRTEREQQKNQKAAALWQALKAKYL